MNTRETVMKFKAEKEQACEVRLSGKLQDVGAYHGNIFISHIVTDDCREGKTEAYKWVVDKKGRIMIYVIEIPE